MTFKRRYKDDQGTCREQVDVLSVSHVPYAQVKVLERFPLYSCREELIKFCLPETVMESYPVGYAGCQRLYCFFLSSIDFFL